MCISLVFVHNNWSRDTNPPPGAKITHGRDSNAACYHTSSSRGTQTPDKNEWWLRYPLARKNAIDRAVRTVSTRQVEPRACLGINLQHWKCFHNRDSLPWLLHVWNNHQSETEWLELHTGQCFASEFLCHCPCQTERDVHLKIPCPMCMHTVSAPWCFYTRRMNANIFISLHQLFL